MFTRGSENSRNNTDLYKETYFNMQYFPDLIIMVYKCIKMRKTLIAIDKI